MAAYESLVLDTLSVADEVNFSLEKLDVPPAKRRQQWATSPDSDGDALIQQSHYDNVQVPFQIRCVSQASIDLAHDLIAKVNAQLVEAELRATAEPTVQCLPAGLPGYWTPATSTRTGILVIQSGTIDERPLTVEGDDAGYFLTNPMPVIRGTLNCLPGVYASILETVTAVSASTPTVQISVPNVPGDMLAPTELTITDTVAASGQERKYADWGMDLPDSAAGRTQLCTNPKGSVNTTGWTNSGFTNFNRLPSAPNGLPGNSCFQVTANGAGQNAQFPLTLTSGHTYHCSAYFGPSNTGQWRLDLYNPVGTLKASSAVVTGVAFQNGPTTRVDLGFTADSTGTWTVRVVSIAGPYSATTLDFNNVLIEEIGSLQSFFDGDSPNASWTGTANASTSTTSFPVVIDATSLVTANYTGVATTRTGAYNGNNVIRGNPLLPTYQQICATPTQTVTGVFGVYARIYALTTDVKIRLKYQVGDGPFRTLDLAASPVLANGFSEVFLGTITVPDTIGGVKPTWVAVVEENSATLADTCDLNFLRLVPTALGSGRLRAPLKTPEALPTIIAYDDCSEAAGNFSSPAATPTVAIVSSTNASPIQITVGATTGLANGNQVVIEGHTVNTNANGAWTIAGVTGTTFTLTGSTGNGVGGATGTVFKPGKTAPLGGSQIGTGSANDFTMDTASKQVQRTALSDADLNSGRFAIFGIQRKAETTFQADVTLPGHTVQDKEIRGGVFVRYKDTLNWLMAVRRHRYFADTHFLLGQYLAWTYFSLYKRVAGVVSNLGDYVVSAPYVQQPNGGLTLGQPAHDPGTFTMRIAVDAAGNVSVYTAPRGADLGTAKFTVAQDSDLKTGGALASGGFGIYDATDITSGSYTRTYDNEIANSPTAGSVHNDAVIRALRSAVVRTVGKDAAIRQDSGGTFYGRVPIARSGVRLALPPAGVANRVPRITVAVRQNDIDTAASLGMTDSTQIGLVYRACYLTGPGAG